jgi:hypothetical protein
VFGKLGILVGLGIVLFPGLALANTVVLTADRDNTLFENSTGSLSNGAGSYLFSGATSHSGRRRALLHFDLSALPQGSTITNVTLQLFMSFTVAGGDQAQTLHRALADWGEGTSNSGGSVSSGGGSGAASTTNDATWIHRFFPGQMWSSAGGDFAAMSSATQMVSATVGSYNWSSAQLTADVQGWANDRTTNFGWVLTGPEASTETAQRFNTRENPDDTTRPKLVVEFTAPASVPIPPWTSAVLGALVVLAGLSLNRRQRTKGPPNAFDDQRVDWASTSTP